MARMNAAVVTSSDRSRALNWIQIGAVAGPTMELPSVALRSANLRLQGSGQGTVPAGDYLAELPTLIDEINAGTIAVKANTISGTITHSAAGRWSAYAGVSADRRERTAAERLSSHGSRSSPMPLSADDRDCAPQIRRHSQSVLDRRLDVSGYGLCRVRI
jgi:hypothetical protein